VLRVVVADDHPLMLTGVVVRLSVEADIDVVGRATNCAELLRVVGELVPEVVVADVTMPDGSVLDFLGAIADASPATRVLLLSATDDPTAVSTALERGAAGFLSKETDSDALAAHVRDVAAGKTVLDARSAAAVAAQLRAAPTVVDTLSARELEVLRLVAQGRSNPEIGKELFVAASTVKTHLDRVYAKFGVNDRAAAVARAKDLKLL
jgi:two-component system, NarL family, nitrate/nitrite response regulator NarL